MPCKSIVRKIKWKMKSSRVLHSFLLGGCGVCLSLLFTFDFIEYITAFTASINWMRFRSTFIFIFFFSLDIFILGCSALCRRVSTIRILLLVSFNEFHLLVWKIPIYQHTFLLHYLSIHLAKCHWVELLRFHSIQIPEYSANIGLCVFSVCKFIYLLGAGYALTNSHTLVASVCMSFDFQLDRVTDTFDLARFDVYSQAIQPSILFCFCYHKQFEYTRIESNAIVSRIQWNDKFCQFRLVAAVL